MCECIEQFDKQMLEHNTKISVPLLISERGKFNTASRRAFVRTEKVNDSKRGKPISVLSSFCPFCGKKYE